MSDDQSKQRETHSYDSRAGVIRRLANELRGVLYLDPACEMALAFDIHEQFVDELAKPASDHLRFNEDEDAAVGVRDLTALIAEELGEEPITGDPYVGSGRSAEAVSGQNIAMIADAEGVDLDGTDAERLGYWPREDDD